MTILFWQYVLWILALVMLALTFVGLALARRMLWRAALVAAVCAASTAAFLPGLTLGLDIAGGTVLVYEVEVPEGVTNASDAIDHTITILRQRVDPLEQRALVWRRVGASRLEIQMPAPSEKSQQLRNQVQKLKEGLFTDAITRGDLTAFLTLGGAAREQRLTTLAHADARRAELLRELAAAHDAFIATQTPYLSAQKTLHDLQKQIEKETGPQQEALNGKEKQLVAALIPLAEAYETARQRLAGANARLTELNLDPADVDKVLALPGEVVEPGGKISKPRAAEMAKLTAKHPGKAAALESLLKTYESYSTEKRPLDDPNDLIAMLRGSGVLEFRIVPLLAAVPDADAYRQQLQSKGPRAGGDKPYRWFALDKPENFAEGRKPEETRRNLEEMYQNAGAFFARHNQIAENYGGEIYLLLANTEDASLTKSQPGWELTHVGRTQDDRGFPAVAFNMNVTGGQYMGALTGTHLHEPMAIVLDGKILSAPTIQSKISSSGSISGGRGGFSPQELEYLVRTLSAGSLQAKLSDNPISINQIGATFGADNLAAGMNAATWALIVVALFMLAYYFFWGAVANFALVANLIIVLGVMAAVNAAMTLPGIAGLVLTIGMAVDANVLIYERIREELERHADLKTAVRQGFDRAFLSIFDANITTLITCVILGYLSTAELKGFAVSLGIGVAANLFTGVFCTRVIIELYMMIFKPKKLPMLPLVIPSIRRALTPNIDWVGHKWKFIAVSLVLIAVGVGAVIARGREFLDIEFRGGTQVTFKLEEGRSLTVQEARERLARVGQAANSREVAEASVVTIGEVSAGKAASFAVATLEQDPKIVSQLIKQAFSDVVSSPEPVTFEGMGDPQGDAPSLRNAPVYPLRHAVLGRDIHRPELTPAVSADFDVTDYLGGVAIVLNHMKPAVTLPDVKGRIERMRSQTMYEGLGFRDFKVIGLTPTGQTDARTGKPTYTSLAVVSRDNMTNYLENLDAFDDVDGLAQTEWALTRDALLRDTSLGSITNISSQVSTTMKQQAIVALILSWLAIALYVWIRFGNFRYGFGAIVALIHDVVIAVGMAAAASFFIAYAPGLSHTLGLEPFYLNLAMVAAALTLIGYSVNDTIVTFDRIRENRGRLSWATPQVINDSINQTLSRTILTAGTVFFSVALLYFIGGTGVHNFAFVMLVGTIVGCYSSIVIAAPILMVGTWSKIAKEQEEINRPLTVK